MTIGTRWSTHPAHAGRPRIRLPGVAGIDPTVFGDRTASSFEAATEVVEADLVVMTKACDLVHRKVTNVIVCPHFSLAEYHALWEQEMQKRNQRSTAKAWDGHCRDIR